MRTLHTFSQAGTGRNFAKLRAWFFLSDAQASEAAADQAIAACGGDAREAVKALLIANGFLERELETQVSRGYMRGVKHGRFNTYSG